MISWEDRLTESVGRTAGLIVVVNEGAEGWRIHLSAARFVIAPRGTPLAEAKQKAEEAIAEIVRAAVAEEREVCARMCGASPLAALIRAR